MSIISGTTSDRAETNRHPSKNAPSWVSTHIGGIAWEVRATWQDRLTAPDSPDWFHLETEWRAKLVKEGRGRSTWRVQAKEGAVFVKVFDINEAWAGALAKLPWNSARREWRTSRRVELAGIRVPSCLALGQERTMPHRLVVLTEEIDGAISLSDAWSHAKAGARGGAVQRRRLIEAVAGLFAEAHRAGFVHRDAHPRNVLIRQVEHERVEAYFVDLRGGGMIRGWRLRRAAVKSLGQLAHAFRRISTRTDRWRFLRTYLMERSLTAPDPYSKPIKRRTERKWALVIASAADVQAVRLAWQRDRRLRGDDRYFGRLPFQSGWTGMCALRLGRRHVFAEPGVVDRTIEEWHSVLRQTPLPLPTGFSEIRSEEKDKATVRIKVVRATTMWRRILWALFGSPARNAFNRSHRLRHRDIQAPLFLGWLEHRNAGLVIECVLIQPAQGTSPQGTAP